MRRSQGASETPADTGIGKNQEALWISILKEIRRRGKKLLITGMPHGELISYRGERFSEARPSVKMA